MANSKNHHFLPQFYLRGFRSSGISKKSQKVWSICKTQSVDCSEELIKDVGYEEHFHTIMKSDGTLDDSLEDQVAKLEGTYSPVRDKLLRGGTLDATERHLLSRFVALMKMRTPAEKAAVNQMRLGMAQAVQWSMAQDDRIEKMAAELPQYKHLRAPVLAAMARQVREGIAEGKFRHTNSNASLLDPMFNTAFDPSFIGIFDKMKLELLKAPMGAVFITGDQPVVLFDPTPPHPSKPGTGLVCPEVEITFPLSSQVLLRFSWKHAPGERMVTATEVDEFNRRTVIMAKKSVFASRRDDAILELIRRNHAHIAGQDFTAMALPEGKTKTFSRMIPVRPAECYLSD